MALQALENEPSVTSALERVVSASQKIVSDRTELVFIEIRELLEATFEGLLALGLAVGLFLLAWVSATAAMIFLLMEAMSRPAALGVAATVNLVIALVLVRVAMARVATAAKFGANRDEVK